MSKQFRAAGALALATLAPVAAPAASDAELAQIRRQIQSLKEEYEARIRALEQRLQQAQSPAAAPAPASSPGGGAGLAAFNPALSVVLQGTYANLSQDPGRFAIAGFPAAGEAGPGKRGFSLVESELTLSANVDPLFRGQATFAVTPENEVSVEEAYAIVTAAPYGLAPKLGRFFSGIGYLNEQHAHAWDFVDAPLAYQAFLGGKFVQDGVQLKWVAPLEHFLEVGAEAGGGEAIPGATRDRNGSSSGALYAHTGGDIGESHSWRAGVSWLRTRDDGLDGRRDTGIADFVWKWAPNGNARETNFKLQGEYFRVSGTRQGGWYAQAVYQFVPRWRFGARYDRLDAAAADPFDARRHAAMLDWSPSEFSRVRLQLALSETLAGVVDRQLFVQYILSLGAHGAHGY
jgi:hypothetical protein